MELEEVRRPRLRAAEEQVLALQKSELIWEELATAHEQQLGELEQTHKAEKQVWSRRFSRQADKMDRFQTEIEKLSELKVLELA